ncbi:hypothetical protein CYMTET_31351 [Cymbomonas tetramitiformis]|uniref:Peptidase S9 prolyl oligopeptidase catalytic domain-containing protein n=1 Tax=Cymbomonas tetramitiformis TaxID=36881 RepID=A0AAE0FH51_9CHLO|nr:hypothetical protein CYMTET_31351 [Cymbomonas tetramitiformis]
MAANGWTNRERYGDANTLFRADIQLSYLDLKLRAILEATISDSDVELTVSNLAGLPVLVRTGSEDNSVPPHWSRRMARLLSDVPGVDLVWSELAGKQHWWWDSKETNDGGAVFDRAVRNFYKAAVDAPVQADCHLGGHCREVPEEFQITSLNPATHHGRGGVRILQMRSRLQRAVVRVLLSGAEDDAAAQHVEGSQLPALVLRTRNVARLGVQWRRLQGPLGDLRDLLLDATRVTPMLRGAPGTPRGSLGEDWLDLCLMEGSGPAAWAVCGPDNDLIRGVDTYGPARQVVQAPFAVVAGGGEAAGDDVAESAASAVMAAAVYMANGHFAAVETTAPVILDTMPLPSQARNTVLVGVGFGNQSSNAAASLNNAVARKVLAEWAGMAAAEGTRGAPPVAWTDGGLRLGPCLFSGPHIAVLTLGPYNLSSMESTADSSTCNAPEEPATRALAMLVMGASEEALAELVTFSFSSNQPLTRAPFTNMVPDFMVVHSERYRAQDGGESEVISDSAIENVSR